MAQGFTPSQAQLRVARSRTRYTAAVGAAGSGGTFALALRAASLAEEGVPQEGILFAVACRPQEEQARRALAACGVTGVQVCTAAEAARRVLEACGEAAPRTLAAFEVNALNEDMKTLGTKPARLREMLKFLYRGVSDLVDRDPAWLITLEERTVFEKVRAFARQTASVFPCELENRALERLEERRGPAGEQVYGFDHVLVDGWTALGGAAQTLMAALARMSLAVAGRKEDPGVDGQPYGRADGIDALVAAKGDEVTLVDLGDMPARPAALSAVVWDTPCDEVEGVAAWLRDRIAAGADPQDLAVVAPNRVWAGRMAQACSDAGVPATVLTGASLPGDARKPDRSSEQRAFTALGLAAAPSDPLLWRLWVGFGDPILMSNAWKDLQEQAEREGRGVVEELEHIERTVGQGGASEPFPGACRLAAAVRGGRAAATELGGLAGPALLDRACALCGASRPVLDQLVGKVGDDEDVRGLYERLRRQVVEPAFEGVVTDGPAVRIGCADAFVGVHVRECVLVGLVEGFFPGPQCFDDRTAPDVRERELLREAARFERAVAVGTDRVVLSRFERTSLAEAEPARMQVERIRVGRDGRERVARVKGSRFVAERADVLAQTRGSIDGPGI